MPAEEWGSEEFAQRYLSRADSYPRRDEGERALLEFVPAGARRVLDLGTGDGRLLALVLGDGPMRGVGVDVSEPMLHAAAERFGGDARVELLRHDLVEPLPPLGRFDVIVSSFAIHHLEDDRKRALYGEIFDALEPGGLFANLEHVASPERALEPRVHRRDRRDARGGRPVRRARSTSGPRSPGCASSASRTPTATGSGARWHCSAGVKPSAS